jgi:ABC-type dipeptide/oligopeptide/nickel transport system permease component
MSHYIIKCILIAIPTTLGALTFIFFAVRLLPGDHAVALLGKAATPEALADMRHTLGLDRPLLLQYSTYLSAVLRGDLGRSIPTNYPLTFYIHHMLPYTLLLAVSGTIVAIVIGVPIGIFSSLRRHRPLDFALRVAALIGGGEFSDPFSIVRYLALPATALGLTLAAFVMRLTRSAMLEVIA